MESGVSGEVPTGVSEPLDMARLCVGERVLVKCRGGRRLQGVLHAFDPHLNLVMGPVVEHIEEQTVDEVTAELKSTETTRNKDMLFVRGDGVILVSPLQDS